MPINELNIDRRKKYILMVDTETANCHDGEKVNPVSALVYDFGCAVVDKKGNVYYTFSAINRDVFVYERDLMQSAYYAWKIPQYVEDIRNGQRKMLDWVEIKLKVREIIAAFGITTVCAHNARFDYYAIQATERYISKSKYQYFFPYGMEWWDTMKMSRSVIHNQPTYKAFCQEHGFMTKSGRCSTTAENLYKYITLDLDFKENHTGLEDVLIEKEILAYCFRQHKAMEKNLWKQDGLTDRQIEILLERQWEFLPAFPTKNIFQEN